MSICLKVELIAGTDITEAVTEMREVAKRLSVPCLVEADFNGIRLLVGPKSIVADEVRQFYDAISRRRSEKEEPKKEPKENDG